MIHIIAVAYRRFGELKVFVQSIINQSSDNWHLTIYHDGPDENFTSIMNDFIKLKPDQISFFCTPKRYNDYGHSLREIGLNHALGDYVLLTNADNYFIPKAVEFLTEGINKTKADIILFDMIHSHKRPGGRPLPAYSFFETFMRRNSIDISSAVIRKEIATAIPFRDKSFNGDATFFEDIQEKFKHSNLSIAKIKRVLFVHN
jgi:glycosyltransferase involved in cell wall biosynthesis